MTETTTTAGLKPFSGHEAGLFRIWAKLLGHSRFSIFDNFFDVGGDSLLAVQVVAAIRRQFGYQLPNTTVFLHPTIAGLALRMRGSATEQPTALIPIQAGDSTPTLYCVHPLGGGATRYVPLARAIGHGLPVFGIQSPALSGQVRPHDTIEAIGASYLDEILTLRSHGRLVLIGYSFGGLVALEMARLAWQRFMMAPGLVLIDPVRRVDGRQAEAPPYQFFAESVLRIPFEPAAVAGTSHRDALRGLRQLAIDSGSVSPDIDLSFLAAIFNVIAANNRAACRYLPQPYPGPAVLFRSTSWPEHGKAMGWDRTIPDLTVHECPYDPLPLTEGRFVVSGES